MKLIDVFLNLVLAILILLVVGLFGLAFTFGPALPGQPGQFFGQVHEMSVNVLRGPVELLYGATHPEPPPTPGPALAFLPVKPPPALTREVVLSELRKSPELIGARAEVTATIPMRSEYKSTALEELKARFGVVPSPSFGANDILLQATVNVAAGIKLDNIEQRIEVSEDGNTVKVRLPPSTIIGPGIDAQKSGVLWFEQTGVARVLQIDTSLFGEAQKDAQRLGVKKALDAGLLEKSDEQVRQSIVSLLTAASGGKAKVEILFDPRPTPSPDY